ncbi:MAG: ATP-binding cassette domain-containing protein, partial [Chitinivibrionales bacterium]|nr:ATP-binding cassette domain-containing protein [Chitinivibrionales bacterium]
NNNISVTVNNGSLATISGKPVVEIDRLMKSFGTQKVLVDVSLKLFNGENVVVLGKSGSGKTILIKCIVRLLEPDGGTIMVLGENINALTRGGLGAMRKKIGFLFQGGALYDSMTVKQNLEFPLRRAHKNLTQYMIDEKVKNVLENVGLRDTLNKMPSQLSGGMRKRISLARTIVVDPMIMLYDEPTTGLDPVTSNEISLLINEVQKKYKTSSIIITHDINCAAKTADRVIMLQDGHVYQDGTLESFKKSTDPIIKSFFQ